MSLPYRNTKPCDHISCADAKMFNRAICFTEAFGYLCEEHWQLALVGGFKPVVLPKPDEMIKLLMEAQE